MAFEKKNWRNYPNTTTPITAEDLNRIEDGVDGVVNLLRPPSNITADDMRHQDYVGEYKLVGSDANDLGLPSTGNGVFRVIHISGSPERGHVIQTWDNLIGETWSRYILAGTDRSWTEWRSSQKIFDDSLENIDSKLDGLIDGLDETSKKYTLLNDQNILQDLPVGRYALAKTGVASSELGYPSGYRGLLLIDTFTSSGDNRTLRYFDQAGGVYSQVVSSGTPRDWVDLTGESQEVKIEGILEELDKVDESSKKFKTLNSSDNLLELPPGKYVLASKGVASEELGYPVNLRGLLLVDAINGAATSRILRYYDEVGGAYTRAITTGVLRSWNKLDRGVVYLGVDEHLYDLGPGSYAQASNLTDFANLGYPTNSRGTLLVEAFRSSNSNRTLFYIAETGGVFTQVIAGNEPRGWVDLTRTPRPPEIPDGQSGIVDSSPRLVVNTEEGHPFYKEGNNGVVEYNDTSTKPVGFQSIRVSTEGNGEQVVLNANDIGPFDITRDNVDIWLRVEDWGNANSLFVYLGTDGLGSHYRWTLSKPANRSYLEEGLWVKQTLSEVSSASMGGSPDPENLTHLSIVSTDDSSGAFTYNVGPIYRIPKSNIYPNGVVSMSFDDGHLNNYTLARPIMDKFGFSGTAYVVAYSIGTSNRMTVDQLREMQENSGWEIGGHTYAEGFHADRLTSFTEEELDGDMANFVQWQKDNDLKGGTFAYPGGTYDDLVRKVTLRYFKAGRAIHRFWETLPPNDIGSLTTRQYVRYPETTPEDIRADIEIAKQQGVWLHICFHGVAEESTSYLQYPVELFEEICEIIYESGIPVRTVEQVVDRLQMSK